MRRSSELRNEMMDPCEVRTEDSRRTDAFRCQSIYRGSPSRLSSHLTIILSSGYYCTCAIGDPIIVVDACNSTVMPSSK